VKPRHRWTYPTEFSRIEHCMNCDMRRKPFTCTKWVYSSRTVFGDSRWHYSDPGCIHADIHKADELMMRAGVKQ
jgi:hypothetical protein